MTTHDANDEYSVQYTAEYVIEYEYDTNTKGEYKLNTKKTLNGHAHLSTKNSSRTMFEHNSAASVTPNTLSFGTDENTSSVTISLNVDHNEFFG